MVHEKVSFFLWKQLFGKWPSQKDLQDKNEVMKYQFWAKCLFNRDIDSSDGNDGNSSDGDNRFEFNQACKNGLLEKAKYL